MNTTTFSRAVTLATLDTGARSPQSGDTIVLADGRHFVVENAEAGVRGWWFTARAQDQSCVVQGNLQFEWDGAARVWRPAGVAAATPPTVPRSMRGQSQPRLKQAD